MKYIKLIFCTIILACTVAQANSFKQQGLALSIPLIPKDPSNLHGYRATYYLQPANLIWPNTRVYLNAGFGHWWIEANRPNKSVSIYTIAPIIRIYLSKSQIFNTYLNLSIGGAWISKTRFDDRNLGMHFAFQDELGFGVAFGAQDKLSATLSALHYSNGSLCNMNAGITIPLLFTIALNFD